MFRKPKVPGDEDEKQLTFASVSPFVPVFTDSHVQPSAQEVLGESRIFEALKGRLLVSVRPEAGD